MGSCLFVFSTKLQLVSPPCARARCARACTCAHICGCMLVHNELDSVTCLCFCKLSTAGARLVSKWCVQLHRQMHPLARWLSAMHWPQGSLPGPRHHHSSHQRSYMTRHWTPAWQGERAVSVCSCKVSTAGRSTDYFSHTSALGAFSIPAPTKPWALGTSSMRGSPIRPLDSLIHGQYFLNSSLSNCHLKLSSVQACRNSVRGDWRAFPSSALQKAAIKPLMADGNINGPLWQAELRVAIEAATDAGNLIRSGFSAHTKGVQDKKNTSDLVTETDIKVSCAREACARLVLLSDLSVRQKGWRRLAAATTCPTSSSFYTSIKGRSLWARSLVGNNTRKNAS